MEIIKRPPSLAEIATSKLRKAIITGELKLGDILSENDLADRLCVSKTPIRNAIGQMKVEGLVEVIPQKGTYVFSLDNVRLQRFSEHRIVLEQAALKLSAERNLQALQQKLAQIIEKMPAAHESGSMNEFLSLDMEFHQAFFDYSGNIYLSESYAMIAAKNCAICAHLGENIVQIDMARQEHALLLDLLCQNKITKAVQLLELHIKHCTNTVY
ncbi:GntR family transcriptional regulator [Polycladidibacter stylochi]|uniref:GntR family transcriptional regulator n=1 Tax=Polycladidibacter stylochi TaxID=1807766 RepID=UPI000831B974|nr:GntR family transcriptional regulator [Pseudovibrio stylochi]